MAQRARHGAQIIHDQTKNKLITAVERSDAQELATKTRLTGIILGSLCNLLRLVGLRSSLFCLLLNLFRGRILILERRGSRCSTFISHLLRFHGYLGFRWLADNCSTANITTKVVSALGNIEFWGRKGWSAKAWWCIEGFGSGSGCWLGSGNFRGFEFGHVDLRRFKFGHGERRQFDFR